jgi:hypothetical protein
VFTRNTKDHATAEMEAARAAEIQKTNTEGLNKALTEKQRLENEMAGVPVKKEELEFELAGAKLDERSAYGRVQRAVAEGTSGTDLEQIGYSYLAAKRRRARIESDLAALETISPALAGATREVSRYQAAEALGTTYEQTGQFKIEAGSGRPISITNNITVSTADEVKTIIGDSLNLAQRFMQKAVM